MNPADYIQSYDNYFWQWEQEQDDDVLCIPHDNTIAYKDFIRDIIEKLSSQGLPPFGSLLLIVIATNPHGSTSLDTVYSIVSSALKTTDDITLSKAISFLKLVSEVPNQYKTGNKRILLLQAIFERCHNIMSIQDSKSIASYHKNLVASNAKIKAPIAFDKHIFDTDFRTISLLSNKFLSVDDIIEKIAGLPGLQQYEIDLEDSPASDEPATRDFVDELVNNQKTFAIGSLIRWLWGGLNIPVHSSLPSQQPLGGISDLTNKGDYDKLLVSEFAYDDIVFLSRLANNEALYIHREVPPTQNDLQRIILIDATLKNWGTPKIVAFAIMLAIANHPKTDIPCSVFVLGATHYFPISIESIHTIIEALQIVEESLHSAHSLKIFLNEHIKDKNKEVLFITEASTLKYAAVQKVMDDYRQSFHYLFLTDAEGNIDIYKKQHSGKKHIQHLKLSLNEIWKKELDKPNTINRDDSHIVDWPILLRDAGNSKKVLITSNDEVFKITAERSVLRLYEKSSSRATKGWDLIYQNLPFKTEFCEIGMNDEGHPILLLFETSSRQIVLINLSTGESKSVEFNQWKSTPSPHFIFNSGHFLHRNSKGLWRIDLSGSIHQSGDVEQRKWDARAAQLDELSKKYAYAPGVLKNITNVRVNNNDQLVLNNQVLTLTNQSNLKWVFSRNIELKSKNEATKIGENKFQFNDGSIVEINRIGMIILKSQNNTPDIYIPTSIDTSLGVATCEEFAGNHYYYKEPYKIMRLVNAGPHKMEIINRIKDKSILGLTEAKHLIDNTPSSLQSFLLRDPIERVRETLESAGATVEIKSPDRKEFSLTSTGLLGFYTKYIVPYIQSIQNHGI